MDQNLLIANTGKFLNEISTLCHETLFYERRNLVLAEYSQKCHHTCTKLVVIKCLKQCCFLILQWQLLLLLNTRIHKSLTFSLVSKGHLYNSLQNSGEAHIKALHLHMGQCCCRTYRPHKSIT